MSLTASLIVKNAAGTLDACLSSVRKSVDEIVVVDTGSTDGTMGIARKYTGKVYKSEKFNADTKPEDFHFGDARNEALDRCTKTWVLSIDADEVLVDGKLSEHLVKAPDDIYQICIDQVRRNPRAAQTGTYRTLVARLFRNNGIIRWSGRCHELPGGYKTSYRPPPQPVPAEIGLLVHHGDHYMESIRRNHALLSRQIEEVGITGNPHVIAKTYYDIGNTSRDLDRPYEAIGYYFAALNTAHEKMDLTPLALHMLALTCADVGLHNMCEQYAKQSLLLQSDYLHSYVILVVALLKQGKYASGLHLANVARRIKNPYRTTMLLDGGKAEQKWFDQVIEDCRGVKGMNVSPLVRQWFDRYMEIAEKDIHNSLGHRFAAMPLMSLSVEGIMAFVHIVDNPHASILDLGAGASSWVLRHLFPNVISVDSHKPYLDAVQAVCKENDIRAENFIHGIENAPQCDYTLFDYGDLEDRRAGIEAAWDRTRVAMYIDDTDTRPQNEALRRDVLEFANQKGIEWFDCRYAEDQFGRWGTVLWK